MSIRAVAEVIRPIGGSDTVCGVAVCGRATLRRILYPVYAGQIPLIPSPLGITVALTEDAGGPADPRQVSDVFYDNPSYTLHVISDDLVLADQYAEDVLRTLYRACHLSTEYGEINTFHVDPPRRVVRPVRPRYDVQMSIQAEVVRRGNEEQPTIQTES